MDDKTFIDTVLLKFTGPELLDFVLWHPSYLTDPQYKAYAWAIRARHAELRGLPYVG